MAHYFRRRQEEPRADQFAPWGAAAHYLETDDRLRVTRQIEVYDQGQRTRYGAERTRDRFGSLRRQPVDRVGWAPFVIDQWEFEQEWATGPWTNDS